MSWRDRFTNPVLKDQNRAYRFSLVGNDVNWAKAKGMSDIGVDMGIHAVPTRDGRVKNYGTERRAIPFTLYDLMISKGQWVRWMIECQNDPTKKRSFQVNLLDNKEVVRIRGAMVKSVKWSGFNRESNAWLAWAVTFVADDILFGQENQQGESEYWSDHVAYIGGLPLYLPGKLNVRLQAIYSGGTGHGMEVSDDEYAGSKGLTVPFTCHLAKGEGGGDRNVEEDLTTLIKLALKDPAGTAPKVLEFKHGNFGMRCVILDVDAQEITRDNSGTITLMQVKLTLQEWFVGDKSRTKREDKGLQLYKVTGNATTYHDIAVQLWGEEDGEDYWQALANWNQRPASLGPCLEAGDVVIVPPWEYVRMFQQQITSSRFAWV